MFLIREFNIEWNVMRKVFPAIAMIFLMAGLARADLDQAMKQVESLRYGNDLIYVGDTSSNVLAKCGEPS